MKRLLAIFAGCLLAAALAFCAMYYATTGSNRAMLNDENAELLWLKKEFGLSEAEFGRIQELHEAYLPQCAEMCRRIAAQKDHLNSLLSTTNQMTAEIEAAIGEGSRLRAECQRQMLKHFFEVSRTMPPNQGQRYLEWVKDRTFMSDFGMPAHLNEK